MEVFPALARCECCPLFSVRFDRTLPMSSRDVLASNFALLQEHDVQLVCLGALAERYFVDLTNSWLLLASTTTQRARAARQKIKVDRVRKRILG